MRAAVVERYGQGATTREVAAGCGLSKATVLRILHNAGVEVRPQGVRY